METSTGDVDAPTGESVSTPSGCIVRPDRTVIATFGPLGTTLASLLAADDHGLPGGRPSGNCAAQALDVFIAGSVERSTRTLDLSALDLGRQQLSIQTLRPMAGDGTQIHVSITPEVARTASEALSLERLLDRVPAVAFVVDENERFVYLNARTRDLFQLGSGRLVDDVASDHFGSGDVRRDILLAGNDDARSDGYCLVEISATEIGRAIVRIHKSSLVVDGQTYVAAIAMDPTDTPAARSRSADREIQLGRLVDLIPAPVWVISRQRRIVRLNEAARALATTTSSYLIGASVDTAYPNTAVSVFGPPEADFESLTTPAHAGPMVASNTEDRVFRVDRTLLPSIDGPASTMAVMLTDLSEVHGAQQELQMKNEVLEHRNAELDQFAHMASHDLRAPLRAIYAFTQMAMEEEGDEHRDHLGAILGSVDRMRSVLDSLLDFATADTKPNFEMVPLSDVVSSVLGDLASDVAESGAVVKVGELPVLQCDETSMRRLFQNLIANAITYAGDAPPSITITSTPEYRFVEIVVTDRGIGFPQDQEDDVFRPFKRLSADSTGQGIGLSMCRRIVESHHGTIRAISQVGGPTSMVVRLPRRRTQ